MPNLRIVSDNIIDRSTLVASSEASVSMAVKNLLIDKKSSAWRSQPGSAATLTATWATGEDVACVALPYCNLSPTATIRVRGYSDTAGANQVLDTGNVAACPEAAIKLRGWTPQQAASAYSHGGGAFARVWFGKVNVKRLVIDINDVNNLQGYIEAARVVAGPYWSTTYNPSSISFSVVDTTAVSRSAAGDQLVDAGNVYVTLDITLTAMPAQDRAPFVNLIRNSKVYPILVSVFPEQADTSVERDTIIYGRRTKDSEIAIQYAFAYTSSLGIQSI